jgi:hypothetical protein
MLCMGFGAKKMKYRRVGREGPADDYKVGNTYGRLRHE